MDYDEFDPPKPGSVEFPQEDEALGLPERQAAVTVSLSWQQVALIIGVNAILSLIISLAVVIVAGRNISSWPGATVAATQPSVAAASATDQAQPPPANPPTPPPGVTITPGEPAPSETAPAETPVEPTVHIVQPGDTLSSIAHKYDISLDDLMRANDLTDPDYVQVGQELTIPLGGLPPATPTFASVPTPTETPLPFNPPTPLPSGTAPPAEPAATVGPTLTAVPTLTSAPVNQVRLVLQVLNPGDLAKEMVQVVNQGPFVRLTGWTLSDEKGNAYTFPDFSLWGGGAINVHTAVGSNTVTDLYWGQPNAMWKAGDLVTLKDTGGTVVATVTVPAPD